MSYEDYLRSPEWKARRFDALVAADHHCQVCYSDRDLEVHHRTYERIGAELPGDLTVLCAECHQLFHRRARPGQERRENISWFRQRASELRRAT